MAAVECPEHGSYCGGDQCCCEDRHVRLCGASSIPWQPEVGWTCNLPAGHAGDHEHRAVVASWYDRSDSSEASA